MKMQRVIRGSLGVLAATAVFGVAAQTATQPKSSITTSPAASGAASGQSGTPWNSNMNPGHDAQRSGGVNQAGTATHQGMDTRTSGSQGGENATRMPHPPTGTGATQVPGQPGSTWETPMNPGAGPHQGSDMNRSGDRMQHSGTSSGMSQGTTDRTHGDTRTSGSEGGENASRMPHPPTGTSEAIGVPGQPGSTMSSGGEGNRAGGARAQ